MAMTVAELKNELEDMPDDAKVYLAVYQHYTPPEDKVTNATHVEIDGEQRLYLEGNQTGRYVPGEVREEFGW